MNSIVFGERRGGRDQNTTACSEDVSSRSKNKGVSFSKKVKKSLLYLSYILIQERLGILAARCALYITYDIRSEKNDILRQYNDEFIPSGAKTQKIKRIGHCKCNVRADK